MNRKLIAATGFCAFAALSVAGAYAGGMFQTWPVIGGASYCASNVTLASGQGCGQTVPAGPATFAGTEVAPFDINAPGTVGVGALPSSALVNITQLGQGPAVDLTTVATSQTIPNNTPFYFLDGSQGSALTVTMPATAVEGQFQWVTCEAATVGTLTVAANTGQTLKGNPNTACVANTGYLWRYQASNTTWYRVR